MLKIKFERYWNDYRRKHEIKAFADLKELEDWIFNQMQQDYTKSFVMSFPTSEAAARIRSDGPWAIEFRPVYGEEVIWIHQIEDDRGIVFSDGKFTSGYKHWSVYIQEWLSHCNDRKCKPKFNFVD